MIKLPLSAGVAAAALLAATTAFAEEEAVVNVYNWSDYIDEEILTEFEAETGIKVVYDVFDS
ncbi:MAG: spermidine/putrescine ABC transporter substrate-binding protein PotF, partial [Rhodospirillaceae bacterium]|nr:spermidine/putrescine ABC transporter substrate-binding protein PotF [Rhodospirillaceae bacterium]